MVVSFQKIVEVIDKVAGTSRHLEGDIRGFYSPDLMQKPVWAEPFFSLLGTGGIISLICNGICLISHMSSYR